jgi:hypothetical protein
VEVLAGVRRSWAAVGVGAAIAVAGTTAAGWCRARMKATGNGLEELTKDELYQRARAADIKGRSKMSRGDLIQALSHS